MSSFQPPPDGFRDALRRTQARRHRRHLLEAAAGGTALAAVAALVLSVNPGGLVSLRQDQPAGHGATPSGSSTVSGTPRPGHDASDGLVQATGSPTSGSRPGGIPTAATPPTATRTAGPSAPGSVLISTAPSRQTTAYSSLSPCADTSGRETSGWCIQPGSSFTGRSGHPNNLSVSLCRLPGALDGQASFPSTLESSFTVQTPSPADRPVWTLAAQHPGQASRHAVAVTAGRCLTWSLTWFARDDSGRDLAAGQYTLVIAINADNISAPNQALVENYAYTVTS